jgi:hypothetical protein
MVVRIQEVADAPRLGGNGAFQAVRLPAGGCEAVVLPRWNVIALALRPAALSVSDVSKVPEICPPKSTSTKVCKANNAQAFCIRILSKA